MNNDDERTRGQYWAEVDCVNALRRLVRAAKNAANWGSCWDDARGKEEREALEEAEMRLSYYEEHGALRDEINWRSDENGED